MIVKNWLRNLYHKIPKLLLLLVVLYALSLNQNLIFGTAWKADSQNTLTTLPDTLIVNRFGEGNRVTTKDSVLYTVTNNGATIGYVVSTAAYADLFRGFGGHTPVALILDPEMVIRDAVLLENHETGRFVRRIETSGFFSRWNGLHLYDPIPTVDVVSGATYTSASVIENVNITLAELRGNTPAPLTWDSFLNYYLGECIILVVVILALICFFAPNRTRRLRLPVLVLSVAVLGVGEGAFVSLDLLYKWFINGTSPLTRFGIFAVVAAALLIPLLTNKSFYCAYLCPFGAAQEMIGRCTRKKNVLSPRVLRIARYVRQGVLALLVILLFLGKQIELADWEPFTVFMIRSASVSAVVLAVLSLVGAFFVQRPWCRLLCPTGEILSILRRPLRHRKAAQPKTDKTL